MTECSIAECVTNSALFSVVFDRDKIFICWDMAVRDWWCHLVSMSKAACIQVASVCVCWGMRWVSGAGMTRRSTRRCPTLTRGTCSLTTRTETVSRSLLCTLDLTSTTTTKCSIGASCCATSLSVSVSCLHDSQCVVRGWVSLCSWLIDIAVSECVVPWSRGLPVLSSWRDVTRPSLFCQHVSVSC